MMNTRKDTSSQSSPASPSYNSTRECSKGNDIGKGKLVLDPETQEKKENVKVDESFEEVTGREKLKRHREEVMGRVNIPENWSEEKQLKKWVDYTTFDALILAPHSLIVAARDALIADGRKARSQRLRIHL